MRRVVVVEGEEIEVEETIFVKKLVSFKPIPVFRYEDTEGKLPPEQALNSRSFTSSAVIAYLSYKIPLGNVKEYIESYGFVNLFKTFARVERVVGFVVGRTAKLSFEDSQ